MSSLLSGWRLHCRSGGILTVVAAVMALQSSVAAQTPQPTVITEQVYIRKELTMTAVSPLTQYVGVGGQVPVTVQVLDKLGYPVAGVAVVFTVSEGYPGTLTSGWNVAVAVGSDLIAQGEVTAESELKEVIVATNGDGNATAILTAGPDPVEHRITAQAGEAFPEVVTVPILSRVIALKLEMKDGNTVVNTNDYVYIGDAPQMPQLVAALKPDGLAGSARWRLHIEYMRNRSDHAYYPGADASVWKTLSAASTWNIVGDLGTDFRGGKATLYCEYANASHQVIFHVRGTNPSEDAAATAIGDTPWYARPIAKWESDRESQGRYYSQFNTVGTLGPNPGDFRWCPNFGAPNGWGIFQLDTPSPESQALWNWRVNVSTGKARLADPCATEAQAWMASQENQQKEEEPSMALEDYVFAFNGINFQKGTARTPTDACTIQRYNGASEWVIYWKNKTPTTPGSWEINGGSYREYVDHVCNEAK